MKEVTISFKGLVFYVLNHWKSILAISVLGSFLACAIVFAGNYNNLPQDENKENAEMELGDDDRAYVDAVYEYVAKGQEIDAQQSSSIWLTLNSEDVTEAEIIYILDVDNSGYLDGIKQAYYEFLNGNGFYEYISRNTNMHISDVKEMISVNFSNTTDSSISTSIMIKILCGNENDVRAIASEIKKYLSEKKVDICDAGFEHRMTLVDEEIMQCADSNVSDMQYLYLYELQSRKMDLINLENSLSDDLKDYYEDLSKDSSCDSSAVGDDENTEYYSNKPSIFSVLKHAFVGLLIGLFIIGCFHAFIYIFANHIDEDDDFEQIFGISVLGKIPGKDYGRLLYKLRHAGKRTFDYDESIRLVSSKICILAKKENFNKIGIIGCGINAHSMKIANDIMSSLKELGIESILIDNPLYDHSSLEQLGFLDRGLLLEKVGASYRSEVMEEVNMAKDMGIMITGIIVVC